MSNLLLLLLPSSEMGSEDETELTRKKQERRATLPHIRQLMSEQHHQQHQQCESNGRIQQLQQEIDKLDVSNIQRLQVEAEALDLRVDGLPLLSAAARTALIASPLPVQDHLDAQRGRPVRDHLDTLIVPTTRGTDVPLGLMMNPVMSHLNSLFKVVTGNSFPVLPAYSRLATNVIGKGKGCLVCDSPQAPARLLPSLEQGTCVSQLAPVP
jgi:hypothetical protein